MRRREFDPVHLPAQRSSQFRVESHELGVALPHAPLINNIFLNFARRDTHLASNLVFDVFLARFFAKPIASDRGQEVVFGVGGVDSDRPSAS